MRGFAITVCFPCGGMPMTYGIMAGTDLPDGGDYGYYARACRQSAQRILYTIANSNAMNFIGTDTRIITYEPEWYKTRDKILLSIEIAFMISCCLFVAINCFDLIRNFQKKDNA